MKMFRITTKTVLISLIKKVTSNNNNNKINSNNNNNNNNNNSNNNRQKHLLIGVFQTSPNNPPQPTRVQLNNEATIVLGTTKRIFDPSNRVIINDRTLRICITKSKIKDSPSQIFI